MNFFEEFIVWFHDQLFTTFPFNLFEPLGENLPDDLWEDYVPPSD